MKRIKIYHFFHGNFKIPVAANRKPQRRAVQHHGMLIASYLLVLLVDAHLVAGMTRTYLPSSSRMTMSTKVRTMAQPLLRLRFIWLANSRGL
jgi:hypothetical protein